MLKHLAICAFIAGLVLPITANAGFFKDYWMPRDAACSVDEDFAPDAVAESLDECRAASEYIDGYGTPRVNSFALATCMEANGYVRAPRAEWLAWDLTCDQPSAQQDALADIASTEPRRETLIHSAQTCVEPPATSSELVAHDETERHDQ